MIPPPVNLWQHPEERPGRLPPCHEAVQPALPRERVHPGAGHQQAPVDPCQIRISHSLKLHHEFLQQSLRNKSLGMTVYKIALLCDAYSTNSECFTLPMDMLVETAACA
ncbi:mediator of RNA polymerase II transcription subunit 23-like isoform 1-T2 [Salvelinus alpinus]